MMMVLLLLLLLLLLLVLRLFLVAGGGDADGKLKRRRRTYHYYCGVTPTVRGCGARGHPTRHVVGRVMSLVGLAGGQSWTHVTPT